MEQFLDILLKQTVAVIVSGIASYLYALLKLRNEAAKIKEAAEKNKFSEMDSKIQLLMDMAHATAQERILYLSAEYQRAGWISVDDLRVYINMVEKYEMLGKNGVVNSAVEKVKALPNVEV